MNLSAFELFAWAACLIGNALLLLTILLRGRLRSFPLFTLYVVDEIATSTILFLVRSHLSQQTYRHIFWSWSIFDEILQILVVYEIALHVFRPTGVWARDVRRTMIEMAAISILIAILIACLAQPAVAYTIQTFILRSNFFSAALMSELFVGMLFLSTTVGLPWKTHVARIAQGFGMYAVVCVVLDIAAIFFGLNHAGRTFHMLSQVRSYAYLACEIYWIVMLWAEAPAPSELPEAMKIQIYTLQRQVENDLVRIRSWRKN